MTALTIRCTSCGENITGESYHLGFSDMDALYCSSCPKVLLLKDRSVAERHWLKPPDLSAPAPGFQPYCRHLLPFFAKVEALFLPCDCGGSFGYMNPPRCPECNGLIRGNIYEDKPILKLNDGYAFVTIGAAVDERQQWKTQRQL